MKHPKSTLQQIANYFSIFGELPVKRRTVRDILSNKETTRFWGWSRNSSSVVSRIL